jgi:hypothetical protein
MFIELALIYFGVVEKKTKVPPFIAVTLSVTQMIRLAK